ncbi:hypothetical protein B7R54_12750 [Subtercola boreus]|uniref:DNA modification methylase n=1 Tax=Subtercola boreus TaxID=120213 RepID=A0A3E0VKK3_9MICO|nr:hypothetical protein [Subtercola boreus]RFA09973.1 hypothetical protein B7R54_12750 [Subtercola boreus]TQL52883.1 hypothetical protein FB464_0370 [Subtercola boreus]
MRTRYAASILVAALVGVSATGCAFITPQATTSIGQVTDGVDGNVSPDLAIRNATLISDDKTSASLIVSLVNTGDEDHQVVVQYEDASGKSVDAVALVGARSTLTVGGSTDQRLVLDNVDLTVGQLFPVFFQYGSVTGTKLLVPVLSSDWEQFDGLEPTATPTPTPTATPVPLPVPTSTSTLAPEATVTPTPAP